MTVPIFGQLGDYYSRKPFVIASIIVFTGASVLRGMAGDMLSLVFARSVQGIGAVLSGRQEHDEAGEAGGLPRSH